MQADSVDTSDTLSTLKHLVKVTTELQRRLHQQEQLTDLVKKRLSEDFVSRTDLQGQLQLKTNQSQLFDLEKRLDRLELATGSRDKRQNDSAPAKSDESLTKTLLHRVNAMEKVILLMGKSHTETPGAEPVGSTGEPQVSQSVLNELMRFLVTRTEMKKYLAALEKRWETKLANDLAGFNQNLAREDSDDTVKRHINILRNETDRKLLMLSQQIDQKQNKRVRNMGMWQWKGDKMEGDLVVWDHELCCSGATVRAEECTYITIVEPGLYRVSAVFFDIAHCASQIMVNSIPYSTNVAEVQQGISRINATDGVPAKLGLTNVIHIKLETPAKIAISLLRARKFNDATGLLKIESVREIDS